MDELIIHVVLIPTKNIPQLVNGKMTITSAMVHNNYIIIFVILRAVKASTEDYRGLFMR